MKAPEPTTLSGRAGGTLRPVLTLDPSSDTGLSASDYLTNDTTPTLFGTASPFAEIHVFDQGRVIATTIANASGAWSTTTNVLGHGMHVFSVTATNAAGRITRSQHPLQLRIDIEAPELRAFTFTNTTGVENAATTSDWVTISGRTERGAVITLEGTALSVVADNSGHYTFDRVPLAPGNNAFTVIATDAAGNSAAETHEIFRIVDPADNDMVLFWNQLMLDAIRDASTAPFVASRAMAIESIAVLDAMNAILGKATFLVNLDAPEGASVDAAVATAAHAVLKQLFPARAGDFDAALAASLGAIPDPAARQSGAAFGADVAAAVLAIRAQDGWDATVTYTSGSAPGDWQPTPPGFASPLAPHWGNVSPFALAAAGQFLPPGPPDLTSDEYAAEYNLVLSLGSAASTTRTADQTEIALFWADGAGTYTPPGHWNAIANQLANDVNFSGAETALIFAMLNVAMADGAIAAWFAKYLYDFWRPVTAIHNGAADGNDATIADTGWTPLINTPPFPEYVSGHSTFSAAAAAILTYMMGDRTFVTDTSGLPGVTRSFDSFWDAANEAGMSRIFGGIHFMSGNLDGLALGSNIGDWVISLFATAADTRAPVVLRDAASGTIDGGVLTLTGFALDDRSGLSRLTASIDGAAPIEIAVSASNGRFTLSVPFASNGLADGAHTITLIASDRAGNTSSPLSFNFVIDADGVASEGSDAIKAPPVFEMAGDEFATGSSVLAWADLTDPGLDGAPFDDGRFAGYDGGFGLADWLL